MPFVRTGTAVSEHSERASGAGDNVSAMQTPVPPSAPNFLGAQVLANVKHKKYYCSDPRSKLVPKIPPFPCISFLDN